MASARFVGMAIVAMAIFSPQHLASQQIIVIARTYRFRPLQIAIPCLNNPCLARLCLHVDHVYVCIDMYIFMLVLYMLELEHMHKVQQHQQHKHHQA